MQKQVSMASTSSAAVDEVLHNCGCSCVQGLAREADLPTGRVPAEVLDRNILSLLNAKCTGVIHLRNINNNFRL